MLACHSVLIALDALEVSLRSCVQAVIAEAGSFLRLGYQVVVEGFRQATVPLLIHAASNSRDSIFTPLDRFSRIVAYLSGH